MNNFYKRSGLSSAILVLITSICFAQTNISGTVTDAESGDPLPGVNILIRGTNEGTATDSDGRFALTTSEALPVTLRFTFTGYLAVEIEATQANASGLTVALGGSSRLLETVTVVGNKEEGALQAGVTVEKFDITDVQQAPTSEPYEGLSHVKGVQMTYSSLNFPQINTRGFATIANTRFVQLIDGMDASAPLLNFPTGNIVGIGELDLESMELQPGSASAIWGPNAFNGILIMNSKNPFEYQGLSAQAKAGITTSEAQGESYPLYNFSLRYAKAFNNKFAFKVNFSIFDAQDWMGNDFRTDINRPGSETDLSGTKDFDGVNLYGDEIELPVPLPTVGIIHRTGWREQDLVDNYDAKSLKADIALHYKIKPNLELSYNYRYGGGSSIYQGSQKYALRNFTQVFHKLELEGDNFFVRGYVTSTDAGDSYNIAALGSYVNERIKSSPNWAQEYALAMQGYFGVPGGNHDAARAFADRERPAVGSPEFNSLVEGVRNDYFQRQPPGAKFIDNSNLYHAQFNYNFAGIEWADLQVGGNFRQYSLFSDGTIFNEDPESGTDFERIVINEYGLYTQLTKTFADALKLTGSLRYDKNENFEGRITPRVSAVYTFNETHNIRASFQTGFRNPDTQAQFIYFDLGTNILLGSAESNAARYGLHNGGAYTKASYDAFYAAGGRLAADGTPTPAYQSMLVTANIPYVKPELLKSFELGYKAIMSDKFFIDLNGYYTMYEDFIGGENFVLKNPTTHQGRGVLPGQVYSPYANLAEEVTSVGVGLGVSYDFNPFQVSGNYNYATFDDNRGPTSQFRAGFNTPENKLNVAVGRAIRGDKNFGFNVNFRWQDEFLWQSDFGEAMIPEFGALDAQLSYKLSSLYTVIKLGASNLLGGDFRTNFGGPFVGQQYFISVTFDEFLNK
ncbi:MAG: TonB-dependent receptor [Cyclobacteriaceae bacterium]